MKTQPQFPGSRRRQAGLNRPSSLLITLLLGLSIHCVQSQSYSLNWSKVAGGVGTSTNGQYSLSGTIGQPDASTPMTGGNYSLAGGFWSLFAVETPGAPSLRIFLTTSNTAVVAWSATATGWTLQQNTKLTGSAGWVNSLENINVAGDENQVTVSPPTGNRFYRLFKP